MKKNGFTLAEVLITLAIIGVVATMTLPTLMTNTGEQQAKAGLKKGINILTEAAQMHEAIEGFHYASITGTNSMADITKAEDDEGNPANGVNSFVGLLKERTKIDYNKTADAVKENSNAKIAIGADNSPIETPNVIYFMDGTAILFDPDDAIVASNNDVAAWQADRMPKGFLVVFDTNGVKGPNMLSNCSGVTTGHDDNTESGEGDTKIAVADISACDDKTNRIIKDQFQLQLRGTVVQPVGAAATWAFAN